MDTGRLIAYGFVFVCRTGRRLGTLLATWWIVMGSIALATDIPDDIRGLIDGGEFARAETALTEAAETCSGDQRRTLLFEAERLSRIREDFSLTEKAVLEKISEEIPNVTTDDLRRWRKEGVLQGRRVDGSVRYFWAAVRNLFRLSGEARKRRIPSQMAIPAQPDRMKAHMKEVIEAAENADSPFVLPQRFRIEYTLSVKPGVVPPGETVRCRLLYPIEGPTQKDIRLVDSSPGHPQIASRSVLQRTIYLEQPAAPAGKETVFSVTYEYTARAFYREIDSGKVRPYDTSSELYREFTAERPPHLDFTPVLRAIAAEAAGDETNPYLKAKRIYSWICRNITYVTMVEYSTVPNISMYCAVNRRGDCGVQGMLFVALCRISGVPARWQSGWSVKPWKDSMHDWSRFYVEPYGWLWADPSRGQEYYDQDIDPRVRDFCFGNLDGYRLISNDDYSAVLEPPKQHFRSEPVDFQRGEVEWRGGNLYFDQWGWAMDVTVVNLPEE